MIAYLKGRLAHKDPTFVIIDVGLKSEGRVAKREFTVPGQDFGIKAGDNVEVFVERVHRERSRRIG